MRMFKFVFAAIVSTMIVVPAGADELGWGNYVNARFGYSIDIPEEFLRPLPPPPGGEGLGFENADRTVHVSIFGAMNALELSIEQYYEAGLVDPDIGRITYKRKTDGWYVLSGYRTVDHPEGPREFIFYNRVAIDDAGNAISGLNMLFPPSMKDFMDPIVTRMSRSLKPPNLPRG